jgi:hypothetical protein
MPATEEPDLTPTIPYATPIVTDPEGGLPPSKPPVVPPAEPPTVSSLPTTGSDPASDQRTTLVVGVIGSMGLLLLLVGELARRRSMDPARRSE